MGKVAKKELVRLAFPDAFVVVSAVAEVIQEKEALVKESASLVSPTAA